MDCMHSTFNIIVKEGRGKYIYPASNLEQAISIFRKKLEENPDSLVVLERNIENGETYENLTDAMEKW